MLSSAFGVSAKTLEECITDRNKDVVISSGGVSGLAEKLQTDTSLGLNGDQLSAGALKARVEAFGANEFEYPPPKTFFQLCATAMEDVTVQILCVAAVISLGIGAGMPKHREEYGYLEGIAIVVVVCVVVFLQAYIDYVKELKFRQLNSIKDNYDVKVVRGGEVHVVTAGGGCRRLRSSAGATRFLQMASSGGSKFKANEAAMRASPSISGRITRKTRFCSRAPPCRRDPVA